MILRGRRGDPIERVQATLDRLLLGNATPTVLEAGCGSTSRITLPPGRRLIGLDISERQLANHKTLDERILGDLERHDWKQRTFDLIVCWDVIEHLYDPAAALQRLFKSIGDGGSMILAFPNFWSLKGLVTKATPFGFHAWFYRHVIGDRRDRSELDQFPTPFNADIAAARVKALAAAAGLDVAYDEIYEGPVQSNLRERYAVANAAFGALGAVSNAATLGRLDLGLSDCILILHRAASNDAPVPNRDIPSGATHAARH